MPDVAGPYSQEFVFGAGRIFAINDGLNKVPSEPTLIQPVQFLSIQEAAVDETIQMPELNSTLEFPDAVASGRRKLTGKVTFGRVDLLLLNQIIFGENTYAAGGALLQGAEAHSIPATPGPYTVLIAPPSSGTYVADLGVYYASSGKQLENIGTVVAAGQYQINPSTGTYTFDAADQGVAVVINYTYSTTTVGHNFTVTSQVMGLRQRPSFSLYLSMPAQGNSDMLIYSCRASKLNRPFKADDFMKPEMDFEAYPNAAGNVYNWCSAIS
ncbi:MAG TPA: hypothetical protein VJW77_02345 [Terriglobia bacterium]|nr:hypothetical protein [Terriglobia bacterium]